MLQQKAANVKFKVWSATVSKRRLRVKIRGSVSDVTAAMEVALETAKPLGTIISHTVIASPTADTELQQK